MGEKYSLECESCGSSAGVFRGSLMSDPQRSVRPALWMSCQALTSVVDGVGACQICGSHLVKHYGEMTRNPNSVATPELDELQRTAVLLEIEYNEKKDQRRAEIERLFRSDVSSAQRIVRELAANDGSEFVLDELRELAEAVEDRIQEWITKRTAETCWEHLGYADKDDWIHRNNTTDTRWHAGRHICPSCKSTSAVFSLLKLVD